MRFRLLEEEEFIEKEEGRKDKKSELKRGEEAKKPPKITPWWTITENRLMWKALIKQVKNGICHLADPETMGPETPESPITFPVS